MTPAATQNLWIFTVFKLSPVRRHFTPLTPWSVSCGQLLHFLGIFLLLPLNSSRYYLGECSWLSLPGTRWSDMWYMQGILCLNLWGHNLLICSCTYFLAYLFAGDLHWAEHKSPARPRNHYSRVVLQTIHRFHNRFSQSQRRPLLGPSPGWKSILALSHWRHY